MCVCVFYIKLSSIIQHFRKVSPPEPQLVTANLLASLNKSINQIRDWLAVLEDMLKKERVDISDVDSVAFMLERQKVRSSFILIRKCLDVIQPTHLTKMELKLGLHSICMQ